MYSTRQLGTQVRTAIAVIVLIIVCQAGLSIASIELLASVRAYITGESIYSKAQKDALLHLSAYLEAPARPTWDRFDQSLKIAEADNLARRVMEQGRFDITELRPLLTQGQNAEIDQARLVRLFRLAGDEPHFRRALQLWREADQTLRQVRGLAEAARERAGQPGFAPDELAPQRPEVALLNDRLTTLERAFSDEMNAGARLLERSLLVINLVGALALLGLGYLLAIRAIQAQNAKAKELAAMIQTLSEAVIVLDDRRRVVSANLAAERLMDERLDRLIGQPIARWLSHPTESEAGLGADGGAALWWRVPQDPADGTEMLIGSLRPFSAGQIRQHTLVLRRPDAAERALVSERKRHRLAEQELAQRAVLDPLTQVQNRAGLEAYVAALDGAGEHALLLLDLNGFKAVNDSLGHLAGDALLKALAQRLRGALRAGDHLFRLGGDEFVAVLRGQPDTPAVQCAVERLRAAAREPVGLPQATVAVSASIGLAGWPQDATNLATLLQLADQRMYEDKRRNHAA